MAWAIRSNTASLVVPVAVGSRQGVAAASGVAAGRGVGAGKGEGSFARDLPSVPPWCFDPVGRGQGTMTSASGAWPLASEHFPAERNASRERLAPAANIRTLALIAPTAQRAQPPKALAGVEQPPRQRL